MRFFSFLVVICVTNLLTASDTVPELDSPREIAFRAKWDGTEQRYLVRLPANFDTNQPHSMLIALHGHGSDRWQFAKNSRDECRAARDAAARHQWIFVSPDYRAKTSWMGPAAEADLLQILDDLNRQYRLENVIVCGGSMGGASALAFAAMHPDMVEGAVSMNGTANFVEFAGFADAITTSFGGSKSEKPDEYRKRSAELFPERLAMPIGLTTGGRDTVVPCDSTLRLANLLKERQSPVQLVHRPDGSHETNYPDATSVLEFVIGKLDPADSRPKPLLSFTDKPKTIVCLGDSVTGVYYHTGGIRAYPEMLEIGLHRLFPDAAINVVNAGISGHTTVEGLARLESDVLSKNPDLVTISFGLNDMVRITPEAYRENLITLIKRIRERNSQVVLCTPNAVLNTTGRPLEKLDVFCDTMRSVGREPSVPVCDQYRAGDRFHRRAPWTWRLTLSDEIHPNMDGHKRMAEELCRTIAGTTTSLDSVAPSRPSLPHVKALLQQRKPIRVLAMSPYDGFIGSALKRLNENAIVEVTPWTVEGKSIPAIEQEAKSLVRSMKPDLVLLAVPRDAAVESDEQFVHGYSWIMNWSLSFGHQEWDCVVVHPSVTTANGSGPRDDLSRQLIRAQHLDWIDRNPDDKSSAAELLSNWFSQRAND